MTPHKSTTNLITEHIDDIDVVTEMQDSFLEYAYSVIYSRALPDARDGLKPVQRRILYMMNTMGLTPDKGHVKSARVTGEVMGKLHPHGDSAIYDALVRMSQDFSLRVPLVDGHGNFGSLDDGPAAARYTEARLALPSLALVHDLGEDVVNFAPNYDNQFLQPEVLPCAFPNLLVNGATGIAVGMATNMPPHNMHEIIQAACHLLKHPNCSLEELMRFVPGPDLPCGGEIIRGDGITQAYETGRGSFKMRASVQIESVSARKNALVVTALPYLVGPEKVIQKIKEGLTRKKLQGISDVTDLSGRHEGLRIVIGIKTGFDAKAVLEQLYRYTPLEENFSINNVALVDGSPEVLGLHALLRVYIDHRIEVITRRSRYRLNRCKDRLHLVDGLLIAIVDIDKIIRIIRTSDSVQKARSELMKTFSLAKIQADHILDLQLRRITKFSQIELEKEQTTLQTEIDTLKTLLSKRANIEQYVHDDLQHIGKQYGSDRRTLLLDQDTLSTPSSAKKNPLQLEIIDAACTVFLSTTGRVVRTEGILASDSSVSVIAQHKKRRFNHDALRAQLTTTTRSHIGAVTNTGRLIQFSPVDLPITDSTHINFASGVALRDYLTIHSQHEHIITLVELDTPNPLTIGTKRGTLKRTLVTSQASQLEYPVITLDEGDEIVGANLAADDWQGVYITNQTHLVRFRLEGIRSTGRKAAGVAGIKLDEEHEVIFFGALAPAEFASSVVVTITEDANALLVAGSGRAKVTAFSEFPTRGRATRGMRCHRLLKGETGIEQAWVGTDPLAVDAQGTALALPEQLRGTMDSGVMLDKRIESIGFRINE